MFENLFEEKKDFALEKIEPKEFKKTGQRFEGLFEEPEKKGSLVSLTDKPKEIKVEDTGEIIEWESFTPELREVYRDLLKQRLSAEKEYSKTIPTTNWEILKGVGKGIKETIKQAPHYVKQVPRYLIEAAKHPYQTAVGIMETGVLKPTVAAWKLILPKEYEKKIIPQMEEGLKEIEEMMPSKEARTVGNLTGWLLPYTAGTKIVMKGMEATNIAIKLGKHASGVANVFGFLGTGQLLFDPKTESSRAKRAIQDLAILAGFRVGGYVLKGASQMAGRAVEKTVMPIFTRIKAGKKVPLAEVEKAVLKARAITEGITKKKPEQIIEKEIIPQAKKVKVSSQKELATLKEINKKIPGIKGIESRIKEIESVSKIKPVIPKIPKELELLAKKERIKLISEKGEPIYHTLTEQYRFTSPKLVKQISDIESKIPNANWIKNASRDELVAMREKLKSYKPFVDIKLPEGIVGKEIKVFQNVINKINDRIFRFKSNTDDYISDRLWKQFKIPEGGFPLLKAVKEVKPAVKEAIPVAQKGVVKPIVAEKGVKLPVGKPSKVALSIEAKAIEKDLTKGFKDLAEYTPTTIKRQAEKMATLMKDVEKAKRVAIGIEPLPEGLNGATVITTMEKYALKTKNGELMAELAKSPLVSETSMAAQTLRMTAEREPESAVRKIQEIIKARKESIERKLKWKKPEQIRSGIKKSLESKIKKTKPNKYSWENLITEITC